MKRDLQKRPMTPLVRQRAATHCNTLHHTAKHFNTLQHTHMVRVGGLMADECVHVKETDVYVKRLPYLFMKMYMCDDKRVLSPWYDKCALFSRTALRVQDTATHCNTLQHTHMVRVLYPSYDKCALFWEFKNSPTILREWVGEVGGWGRVPFSRNLMSPTPRRKWYLTTGRRFH